MGKRPPSAAGSVAQPINNAKAKAKPALQGQVMKAKAAPASLPGFTAVAADKKGKKKRSDIDDIFGMASGAAAGDSKVLEGASGEMQEIPERIKKARKVTAAQGGSTGKAPAAAVTGPVLGSKDDLFGDNAQKQRKRTEEGYAIYTEDELRLGSKGGDTDLCPFDCDCCF